MRKVLFLSLLFLASSCTQQPSKVIDSQALRDHEIEQMVNAKNDVSIASGWIEVVKGGWEKTDGQHYQFQGTTVEAQMYMLNKVNLELNQIKSQSNSSFQEKGLREFLEKEVESLERNIKSISKNEKISALSTCSANATAAKTTASLGAKASASASCPNVMVEANAYASSNQTTDGGTNKNIGSASKSAVAYGTSGCSSRASAKGGVASDFDTWSGCY